MKLFGFGITKSGGGGGGSGIVESIVAGRNITVDDTDPANPIVATTADDITVVANYAALPDPTTVSGDFYWCSASQGTKWLPFSVGGTYYSAGMYYSNGTTWEFISVPYQATQAQVNTGTNDDTFVTPLTLTNATVVTNKAPLASPTFTGTVTTPAIIVSSETASRVAIIDGSKNVKSADTTTYPSLTEFSYGKGVTSAIQTQLNIKSTVTVQFTANGFSPADSTSYWFLPIGTAGSAATSTAARFRVRCPINVSNFGLLFTYNCNSGGTNEGVTLTLRNHTQSTEADFTTTLDLSIAADDLRYSTSLNCNIDDELELIMKTPAWATNPAVMVTGFNLYF